MKRKANESEASGEARLSEVKRQHTQAQTQTENLLTDGQTRTHTHPYKVNTAMYECVCGGSNTITYTQSGRLHAYYVNR